MAQNNAPNTPRANVAIVDVRSGLFTEAGADLFRQLWRQVAAGFVVVPCEASGVDALTLTPILHAEGGRTYGDHMPFSFVAPATSTGAVTARVADLAFVKVYKTNGAAQAGAGDVVNGSFYVAHYVSELDGGAGGFVLK